MHAYWKNYSEMHSLEFDNKNSECGSCTLSECGYYYNQCPMQGGKFIVTNAFSGNMINIEKYSTKVSKISEEEFLELIQNAESNISHPGIARRYNLKLNPGKINLVPGDELVVVYIHGGKLPANGKLPWNVNLSFEHIRVIV
ncbi:MAG: hypothetical protein IJQ68_05515 [Methanobrevibacter sp.]|uniref:hypothetical protein n=1 Tax=Methanobrevibacter sp. TaxID=66852 RepID=UPI0025F75270|nr:hypothetical protein [Methanobrevibacter sp.]MBR0271435.1 hypothetical protein [Methanobrevibacter sp.]